MAEYEVIEPQNQHINIDDEYGGVFENKLIDLRGTDKYCVMYARGSDWVIRNVGFAGNDTSGEGITQISVAVDDPGGTGTIENVFHSGASEGNPQDHGHGATGIQIPPPSTAPHAGHIDIRNCYISGMADNGFYCSEDFEGTVTIDNCFGKNNYVATFRINENGEVLNSVAFNDDLGYNGRCVWVWPDGDGEARLVNLDLFSGEYSDEIHIGRDGETTDVYMEDVRYAEGIDQRGTVNLTEAGVNGGAPDTSVPSGIPTTAVQAASGVVDGGDGGAEPPLNHRLIVTAAEGEGHYEFDVDRAAEVVTEGDCATELTSGVGVDDLTGGARIIGFAPNGDCDTWLFSGSVTRTELPDGFTLSLDGQEVTPEELKQITAGQGVVVETLPALIGLGVGVAAVAVGAYLKSKANGGE